MSKVKTRFLLALTCGLLFLSGCNSQTSKASQASAAESMKSAGFLNACSLIDSSEIAASQSGEVKSADAANQKVGALAISRCYYAVFSKEKTDLSVHLEVIQSDPASANSDALAKYWEKSVHRAGMKGEEEEEGEEAPEAKPVSGVGEQAFWFGSDKGGVFYAMAKNRLVRLSLGGPGSAQSKIEKSKTLVMAVFSRLSQSAM